jgi:hypothetical protein
MLRPLQLGGPLIPYEWGDAYTRILFDFNACAIDK